jgi:GNAT superfamily N-acetyltransferase
VPPLLIDVKSRFSKKYPFYDHGEVEPYLARDASNGEVLGRVCAVVNRLHNEFHHDTVGFFGFFECVRDDTAARALLDAVGGYLKQRGLTVVRGPMNLSINEEMGLLVQGFETPPVVMMTHNPPYYNDLMEACGLVKAKDVVAYQLHKGELADRIARVGERLENRLKLRIRPFNKKDFWGEVERIRRVFNDAWEANWGFVPMTDRELKLMAETLKLMYDPRLIFFCETDDSTPVGFCLALPDVHVLFKKMNGHLFPTGIFTLLAGLRKIDRARVLLMGVHRDYRGRGIDTVFYYRLYQKGVEIGYRWGEFSWILEDNKLMIDAARSIGAVPYKTWRIWEKSL